MPDDCYFPHCPVGGAVAGDFSFNYVVFIFGTFPTSIQIIFQFVMMNKWSVVVLELMLTVLNSCGRNTKRKKKNKT